MKSKTKSKSKSEMKSKTKSKTKSQTESVPVVPLVRLVLLAPVYLMLAPSSWLRLPLTCTAGVRILLLLPNYNLMAKTDSASVKAPTSTSFNPTNTTLVLLTLVLTYTRSLFALRSTNLRDRATSPELITLPSNLFFPTPLYLAQLLLKSEFMLPTTMFSA